MGVKWVTLSVMSGKAKCAAYSRVSTLLGQNPEHQLSHIRQFAEARGFELVAEYTDRVSGVKERRKALDALIKDARTGRFKILIVSGIDRLARDTRHLLNLIHELDSHGIALISLRESIDFTTPMGKATLAILGAIGSLERDLCRERTRTALAAKKLTAAQTGWRCGRPRAATDEIITQVVDLHDRGMSHREIERALNKKVSRATVTRILQGRFKTSEKIPAQVTEITTAKNNVSADTKTNGFEPPPSGKGGRSGS